MKLTAAIPVIAAICLVSVVDAQHPTRPAAKPSVKPPTPPASEARPEPGPKPPPNRAKASPAENGPGSAENLARLLKLSPEQRNKALSALPPPRRAVIEQRLSEYQQMPEPERTRTLEKLRRMQRLPPQKQNQVRASSKRFLELTQPRRGLVRRQINQLKPLSDADRSAMMNSEEFRNKFTPAEQQMIEDICLVTPQEKP